MKTIGKFPRCMPALICLTVLIMLSPSYAAMNDYCITPPFVVGGVNPNLLLMIDNSASMFDLAHIDKGSTAPLRKAFYCYDRTYFFIKHYPGYFQDPTPIDTSHPAWYIYFEYDFTNDYFYETNLTQAGFAALSCDKKIQGTLCINGANLDNPSTGTVTRFVAEGNYLNWLTASKFDIEKLILTGGKYNTGSQNVISEGRGCVGRRFIKEPITAQSFQEYTPTIPYVSPDLNDPNVPLGLTFAVKGPNHPYSKTLPSPGGQTYLEIYAGDYTSENCQEAVRDIINLAGKNEVTGDIERCLNYDSKGQYCSLDTSRSCTSDADCAGTAGTCNVVNDGTCGAGGGGVCGVATPGTCTANNGTCPSGKKCIGGSNAGAACNNIGDCPGGSACSKACSGGGKAGTACNNDNDCLYKSCTVGKTGSLCSVNTDCDAKTCTTGLVGISCIVNADCDVRKCTAGLPNTTTCDDNTDCNTGSGTCTAGNVGAACTVNNDCAIGYNGVCQKPVTQQIKSTFGQSMHECYDYWNTGSLTGNNWLTMMTNPQGCNQMYKELFTCNGGSRADKTCVVNADCTGGGTCVNGPEAIKQGSPVLVCGLGYVGYCASSTCSGGTNPGAVCQSKTDCTGGGTCWSTTNWNAREYGSYDLCVKAKFEAYCGAAQVPPVTDPTDDPSTTENFDNLPAIIGDMGIGSQLGDPIKTLSVNIHSATAPSGLIQEFESLIHFGAMDFNSFGSSTECPANFPCTKKCLLPPYAVCMTNADCAQNDSCVIAANIDGGKVIDNPGGAEGYIQGRCSLTATTTCAKDSHCPSGEICVFSVGNHSSGLVSAIDNISASTWTPFAEGFYDAIGYFAQRTDKRLNGTDFIIEADNSAYHDPVQYRCQKNNLLLITDGMSTADLNPDVNTVVSSYNDGDGQIDSAAATCPKFAGSRNLDDLAWLAKNRDIKDFNATPPATAVNSRTITTYVVYNGVPSTDPGECNPDALLQETADNGCGTAPALGCYQRAESYDQLIAALRKAFQQIAGRAASGTAASVLASGEGSGANLVQAIFYPERTFTGTQINWTGSLKNLWYYIDPFLGNSSIREDTNLDKILNVQDDYVLHFYFDASSNSTKAKRFDDSNGDGAVASGDEVTPEVDFEIVKNLWEAGSKLWGMNPGDRTIYTYDGTSKILLPDTIATGETLISLLNATNANEATAIARYVKGTDLKICSTNKNICNTVADCTVAGETCDPYRSRTVSNVDLNGNGDTTETVDGVSESTARVWKLGDIINSTPRIVSWVPLNLYNKSYKDKTYEAYTKTTGYQSRGMVLVGANDGMLHAFNLGGLKLFEEKYKKAELTGTAATLGKEEWAFIPKNALPYLKYMTDASYCHLYYLDATPVILDASINPTAGCAGNYWDCEKSAESWRTIIIGSMRIGGACKSPTDSDSNGVADACTKDMNGDGTVDNKDCVLRPAAGNGYSSYFALDITDMNDPQLLWEFSNENLGFSTTGPVVVRIAAKKADNITPDNDKNGRWFAVFGSGSTGPIDTNTHQFKGYSDQNLGVFIVDLRTGTLLRTIDSGIQNAFAGSMINSSIDFDQNDSTKSGFYQDDAIYFGFTKAENNPPVVSTKWNVGGVLRLLTKESLDPNDWALSKVIEGIGPVTAAVARLQNYSDPKAWLFFGTGRYSFKIANNIDDAAQRRSLYGIKEPCYSISGIDVACTTTVSRASLGDATSSSSSDSDGWYIDLDSCTTLAEAPVLCSDASAAYKTERNVTDPLSTSIGAVFFTTTSPSADVCEFGGTSHLWAVKYDTGGAVSSSVLRGRAILQVSTGSIEEVNLKTAFTQKADESGRGRRTIAIQGVPPAGAPPGILVPPPPINKFIHLREK